MGFFDRFGKKEKKKEINFEKAMKSLKELKPFLTDEAKKELPKQFDHAEKTLNQAKKDIALYEKLSNGLKYNLRKKEKSEYINFNDYPKYLKYKDCINEEQLSDERNYLLISFIFYKHDIFKFDDLKYKIILIDLRKKEVLWEKSFKYLEPIFGISEYEGRITLFEYDPDYNPTTLFDEDPNKGIKMPTSVLSSNVKSHYYTLDGEEKDFQYFKNLKKEEFINRNNPYYKLYKKLEICLHEDELSELLPEFDNLKKEGVYDAVKAKLFRKLGEKYYEFGNKEETIKCFEIALKYNDKVGVKRLYNKLKKEL